MLTLQPVLVCACLSLSAAAADDATLTSDLQSGCPLSAASTDVQLSQTAAAVDGASRNKEAAAGGTAGRSTSTRVMIDDDDSYCDKDVEGGDDGVADDDGNHNDINNDTECDDEDETTISCFMSPAG